MSNQYGLAQIVTDGLVLCLDAADGVSYPGSGNTWYDRYEIIEIEDVHYYGFEN